MKLAVGRSGRHPHSSPDGFVQPVFMGGRGDSAPEALGGFLAHQIEDSTLSFFHQPGPFFEFGFFLGVGGGTHHLAEQLSSVVRHFATHFGRRNEA